MTILQDKINWIMGVRFEEGELEEEIPLQAQYPFMAGGHLPSKTRKGSYRAPDELKMHSDVQDEDVKEVK